MKIAIDTNSLLALVRYYLPFDNDKLLYNFIKEKISSGEILITDKVNNECKNKSKGLAFDSLHLEEHKKSIINTSDILPDTKFFNLLVNNFCDGSVRNRFSDEEFESEKTKFLESADAKLVLMGYHNQKSINSEKFIIVSEETSLSNDGKTFKKIPFMCGVLRIEIITLPRMLQLFSDLKIEIKNPHF